MHAPAASTARAVEAETTAEDPPRFQADGFRELPDEVLFTFDEIGAAFRVLPAGEAVANRHDTAADAIARFRDRDARPVALEIPGGRQARKPGAGDDDVRAGEAHRERDAA
jgi:hypothetical protein